MQSSKQPPRLKSLNWEPQSSLCVFIRNLKLLQLDLQPDWPDITTHSLSPSSQNQRQRIKAVEWALYHLVALWDLKTAQDKLRPFFPPLEPLQSVNLRAALSRVLTDLKKNGDLGRETIFRKSMLDDCKGDKFDELLAVFSTAVLRKVLNSSVDGWPNRATRLSMAKAITPDDYQLMVPLILAHRGSLATMGERRSRIMDIHEQFSQLLAVKKAQLEKQSKGKHHEELKETGNIDVLAREIKENWMGSEEWADTLLFGGARSSNDAFLELPFEAAWTKVNRTTVEDLTVSATPDLLVDLESRISRQKARLQKWREYSAAMQKKDSAGHRASGSSTATMPLLFRDHQALTVASISKAVRQPLARASTKQKDQSLLRSMNEALSRIDGKSRPSGRAAPPLRVPAAEATVRASPEAEQVEPTRPRSMHRPSPPLNDEAEHAPDNNTLPPKDPVVQISPEADEQDKHDPRLNTFTLVERTRKSMSLLPPPPSRPREPRRSRTVRASFPANQFETPEKQSQSRARASTPRDELFEEEADYSSVFKSRPRVAHSPIASPAVHVNPLGAFDLEADGESVADLEEMDFIASPSMRRRRI
ncbi:uncharacterized protein ACLA_070630 [Aspergillus clavatus NRRL 1]|uniref:HAUS augmin-like complex subunit 6 N-terminal domain-containing protein n=1 Tax=Aspergillus clavatus (strain ATCC 1007 / CBS 513.65 / DSM 816 / NCTC 3887 / NRRL 1 / QM 1276 / 107) TaxID=344612 RepID=A1C6K9_ASPCL|nr:uncharacterized protein ACLA_070630 [Aspergillus clavatus NRRL 1]EAW14030.1 conserved hypothetical protein [Aspergillus clavatus NRRL 1]